jgi:hypothetical protein
MGRDLFALGLASVTLSDLAGIVTQPKTRRHHVKLHLRSCGALLPRSTPPVKPGYSARRL